MADSKIATFVETLKNKTINGSYTWDQTSEEGVFMLSFSNYSVQISQESNPHEYDSIDIVLRILDSEGAIVEEIRDYQLKDNFVSPYIYMEEMYSVARRQAMGVEKAIDSILYEMTRDDSDIPF